jgi:hypothetical protein
MKVNFYYSHILDALLARPTKVKMGFAKNWLLKPAIGHGLLGPPRLLKKGIAVKNIGSFIQTQNENT